MSSGPAARRARTVKLKGWTRTGPLLALVRGRLHPADADGWRELDAARD